MGTEHVKRLFDRELEGAAAMICGANEEDYHYVGFEMGRIEEAHFAELYEAKEGDACPCCDGTLTYTKGIEVGHIFKLGTVYSAPLKAEFLNEQGKSEPFVMGTYGMGVSRLVAAVIEQSHDEKGCIWTRGTAPYMVNIVISNVKEEAQSEAGEKLYADLQSAGVEVIIDDRKERFGFKMKDAELIGFPYTVIIGKELQNGTVQIMERATLTQTDVRVEEVLTTLMELLG